MGKAKQQFSPAPLAPEMVSLFQTQFQEALTQTVFSNRAGKGHIAELKDAFLAALTAAGVTTDGAADYFETKVSDALHHAAIHEGKRPDGRALDAVRPLYAQAGGVSPVLHGSGIFYRGGPHVFTALTLGGPEAAQLLDTMEERDTKKRYMHHYNFPPFSVGETGRVGGFNRRMVGHGALAEKALLPVLPDQSVFPYTIRLVSETMSSNGSSSMASVCGSTLALMDGGVPITRPVAGIASGLMLDGERYALLTDIQGPEDEHGDMDFKVAGTEVGVTAIQMDVKVSGVPVPILAEALEAARRARRTILTTITTAIAAPRPTISPRAPEIISLTIRPEYIGKVIGGGGKTINRIKEESGVEEITIEDDGTVFITGTGGSAARAADAIRMLTREFSVGDQLEVTISKIATFGAFARIDAEHEGLIHISEIVPWRIEEVGTILHVGDVVPVVVCKVEEGKIGLSIKQRDPEFARSRGLQPPQ